MNLELRLQILVGSVVAFWVHVLRCFMVEFEPLFAPDWLMQFVFDCASW